MTAWVLIQIQVFFGKIGVFFYDANDEIHRALRRGEDYTFPESEKVDWVVL